MVMVMLGSCERVKECLSEFIGLNGRMNDWMNDWMNEWIDCYLCVCVYGWLDRSTCFQGAAVAISSSTKGTFTNCKFTSNVARAVSLAEECVDSCETSASMTLMFCAPHAHTFLTGSFLLPVYHCRNMHAKIQGNVSHSLPHVMTISALQLFEISHSETWMIWL